MQIWDQCDVDQRNIVMSHIMLELADRFQERLAFDVSDGSTDFDDRNLGICSCRVTIETALDLIRDMRDDLYGSSTKISTTFFLKNGPVNLSCRYIRVLGKTFIDKSFIMSKVKVCLSSIVCYKNFTVLYRIHCTRVNVDVRIKFLHCNCVPACLEQTPKRSCCDSFSKT